MLTLTQGAPGICNLTQGAPGICNLTQGTLAFVISPRVPLAFVISAVQPDKRSGPHQAGDAAAGACGGADIALPSRGALRFHVMLYKGPGLFCLV